MEQVLFLQTRSPHGVEQTKHVTLYQTCAILVTAFGLSGRAGMPYLLPENYQNDVLQHSSLV